jgi:ribonuclease HI
LLLTLIIIDKWSHSMLVRLALLPREHLLHKPLANKKTCNSKCHRSPLIHLRTKYDLDPNKVEKIPTTTRNPSIYGKLPFTITITEDRPSSTNETTNATEKIQVFIDGSALNGKVSAAAILLRMSSTPRILHKYLGPESKHTVHEAELVGILLALHLISIKKKANTSCMIGVDNQAAIKAFKSNLRSPGHHLAREVLCITNRLQKKRKGSYSLTMRWTAGHKGIEGNEKVDKEAKKAAEGHSSEEKSLPPYLRKPLLINTSAIKSAYNAKLNKQWVEEWKGSINGKRDSKIEKNMPSKSFLMAISKSNLSRDAASHIMQFRIMHTPVNHYLKRINKVDSSRCPACRREDENIDHFLLACPSYDHKRWALTCHAKKLQKQLMLETLLETPEMFSPLTNYIKMMHRFKFNGE